MKIQFSINLTPSKGLTRWALMLAAPVAVFAGATLVARANVNNLVSFTPGTTVKSAELNGNFDEIRTSVLALEQDTGTLQDATAALEDDVAALQTDVAALQTQKPLAEANGKTYSIGAIFRGATAIAYTGNLTAAVPAAANGYAAAKTLCEVSLSSPSGHMCTADEVLRSMALGLTVAAGGAGGAFFGTGVYAQSGSYLFTDCRGWTSASGVENANSWTGTVSLDASCEFARPLLCCD